MHGKDCRTVAATWLSIAKSTDQLLQWFVKLILMLDIFVQDLVSVIHNVESWYECKLSIRQYLKHQAPFSHIQLF